MIKQANELAAVLCDLESDHLGEKEDRNNIEMYAYYQRKNKS